MKKHFLIFVFLFIFAGVSFAQEETDTPQQFEQQTQRPNLLRELGLTQEQVRQIRLINAENKDKMRDAQARLREATRSLDQAVYADALDEELLRTRLREVVEAQAEVTKLRAAAELAVRRVLTPEQLTRFREIRQRFIQLRQERQNKRLERQNRQRRKFPNQQ